MDSSSSRLSSLSHRGAGSGRSFIHAEKRMLLVWIMMLSCFVGAYDRQRLLPTPRPLPMLHGVDSHLLMDFFALVSYNHG